MSPEERRHQQRIVTVLAHDFLERYYRCRLWEQWTWNKQSKPYRSTEQLERESTR